MQNLKLLIGFPTVLLVLSLSVGNSHSTEIDSTKTIPGEQKRW